MGDMNNYSNMGKRLPHIDISNILPKPEIDDFEVKFETSMHMGNDVASSSGSSVRSLLRGMGFLPSLIERVIAEKGEDDVDLLLETLVEYSGRKESNFQSSGFSETRDATVPPNYVEFRIPKEEPDVLEFEEKKASLLNMNFSIKDVEFALEKLGVEASMDELVDFILAAQIAETHEIESDSDSDDLFNDDEEKKDVSEETLYGTMEKTLNLLQMGFSENEISSAMENLGSEAPVSELAEAICASQLGEVYVKKEQRRISSCTSTMESVTVKTEDDLMHVPNGGVKIEIDGTSDNAVSHSNNTYIQEKLKGKRPKDERFEVLTNPQFGNISFEDSYREKRPKQLDHVDLQFFIDPIVKEEDVDPRITMPMPRVLNSNPSRKLDRMVARPPYFFYGNVATTSLSVWERISKFLYAIEPEFVDTSCFSALSRTEGYIHNLPTENRFHILPKPPMTILDALPHTKKYCPLWDTRKHLVCINSETDGLSQICEKLRKMLIESRGFLSSEQKREILRYCETLNLMWIGANKLGLIEPDYIEHHILGYPINHTQATRSTKERLEALKSCFQIDTLAYHISVLKAMYPEGITVFSIFSGLGGAEIACHRLGIPLKGVISVESCEIKRRVLKSWWQSSGQTGQLEQLEDIHQLTTTKIEKLLDKFGGVDFIICQNAFCENSKRSKAVPSELSNVFDFSLYYEFIRVLQRIRSSMERRK